MCNAGISLDRSRRLFAQQDLHALLLDQGIDLTREQDADGQEFPAPFELPIELFDDHTWDMRTPEEWIALAEREPDLRGVPAKCLYEREGKIADGGTVSLLRLAGIT